MPIQVYLANVVVYTLFDEFKTYGPKVVVKATPNSFCICGDKIQQIWGYNGWCVWSYLQSTCNYQPEIIGSERTGR